MARAQGARKEVPARVSIVPYLVVPPKGEPWLLGNRCPQCGVLYLGRRMACSKCSHAGPFEETTLSKNGKVYVYSVVYQSIPQVRAPYVTVIVDLPGGVSVRGTLREVVPDPRKVYFDMPVEMFFESAGRDGNGSEVISYYFRPAKASERVPREPIMRNPEELAAMKAARGGRGKPAAGTGRLKAKKSKKKAMKKKSARKKPARRKTPKKKK